MKPVTLGELIAIMSSGEELVPGQRVTADHALAFVPHRDNTIYVATLIAAVIPSEALDGAPPLLVLGGDTRKRAPLLVNGNP
jgi:hypothetical protein